MANYEKCALSLRWGGGGEGTFGISRCGCAAVSLEPLQPIPELVHLNFSTLYTRVHLSLVENKEKTFTFLVVLKNSLKRVLILDTDFQFSTPYSKWSRRWFHAEQCQASTYALSRAINCLILTSIKTTDFRLNPGFWHGEQYPVVF